MFWKLILFGSFHTFWLPWIWLKWKLRLQVSCGSFNMLWGLLASRFHNTLLMSCSCFVTLLTLSLELSKRRLFSCSFFYCPNGIVFVTMKWLHFRFDDVSNFALYSKTFTFFARMMPSIVFFNGRYNLRVSWLPSSSIDFSQPISYVHLTTS